MRTPIKNQIPNLITLSSLFCGLLALQFIWQKDLLSTSYCLALALAFDYMDGFVARLLKATSELGKQLDSLADLVNFGVAPGYIMAHLIELSLAEQAATSLTPYLPYLGYLIPLASAMRLANFNIDSKQTSSFLGLPTPANGALVLSYWWVVEVSETFFLGKMLGNPTWLVVLTVLSSLLLVAPLPLLSLKFSDFSFQNNRYKYFLILGSLILLSLFQHIAIPFIILLYIALSLFRYVVIGSQPDTHSL